VPVHRRKPDFRFEDGRRERDRSADASRRLLGGTFGSDTRSSDDAESNWHFSHLDDTHRDSGDDFRPPHGRGGPFMDEVGFPESIGPRRTRYGLERGEFEDRHWQDGLDFHSGDREGRDDGDLSRWGQHPDDDSHVSSRWADDRRRGSDTEGPNSRQPVFMGSLMQRMPGPPGSRDFQNRPPGGSGFSSSAPVFSTGQSDIRSNRPLPPDFGAGVPPKRGQWDGEENGVPRLTVPGLGQLKQDNMLGLTPGAVPHGGRPPRFMGPLDAGMGFVPPRMGARFPPRMDGGLRTPFFPRPSFGRPPMLDPASRMPFRGGRPPLA
jgi:hypothetical protein